MARVSFYIHKGYKQITIKAFSNNISLVEVNTVQNRPDRFLLPLLKDIRHLTAYDSLFSDFVYSYIIILLSIFNNDTNTNTIDSNIVHGINHWLEHKSTTWNWITNFTLLCNKMEHPDSRLHLILVNERHRKPQKKI